MSVLGRTLLVEIYRCIISFMATSAVVFDTTFAVENFDYLSMATKMQASLFDSSRRGPAKSD